jgi:hypothetical protein
MKYLVINGTQGKLVKETRTENEAMEAVEHYVQTFSKDTFYVACVTMTNAIIRHWR